ncbi:molybdopterin-guanine dinucleotide biosynthesis protein B [Sneathiella litorea]|uniref:Molybdopterin-guanine dinucleotide biosynthesis protein B n=1 Tax=Sneathiella litorea TaxID=2606216 RepID=A0A6L8WBS6_9PROT|nr:molybdopterin-guanine dinucleotide biosynthesis protein B [Sneathiella litorea]MZR32441.1 molybdopterin-guanine dinucleotide biosynthesis protein B [Sneathiella litorea]
MNIIGISGWSGNGKTTLLTRLIPALKARGFKVSTIKHAHHKFDIDVPGKDSYRHREAGAEEVLISSSNRWALMHENHDNGEAHLEDLIARMAPVDILLVEGFKSESFPKIEVWRQESGTEPRVASDDSIVALATPDLTYVAPVPILNLNNENAIADFIVQYFKLEVTTNETAG